MTSAGETSSGRQDAGQGEKRRGSVLLGLQPQLTPQLLPSTRLPSVRC